jgi:diguanylate cyclase (GGDEF)-like protein
MADAQSSILIVDDDAEDLASVERTLRSLGSELVSIKDPHEVMPSVHRHRPDVVIVDALLPGLSGFDLCKQIKTDSQLKGTQVLILTGVYLRQQYRHEAIQQFKADAFLTKPFRPPELQRLVVQLLARKTRVPQLNFLKRIGLPVSSEPKKWGLLGRIFGRSEAEEPETVRIAPAARDIPPAPPAEPVVEAAAARVEAAPEIEAPAAEVAPAPAVVEEPKPATAPEAKAPEPTPVPKEPLPVVQPEAIVEAEVSAETGEVPPPETVEEEPSPSILLDRRPPSETEEVNWVQVDSKTQEMRLEEAAARVAKAAQPPAAFEDLAARESEPTEESPPAADSSQTMRRPLFRVGEVPIYDEPDFLIELKRELSKCKRVDRPLTLILIRVGDLGQIIELFGKDFREPVLWHIAEQAMESLREVDLVGMMTSTNLIAMTAFASDRYGGGRIVSRMRQAVSKKPFRVSEELPPIIPSLDFGMATFPADGSEVSNLMRRAEEDLTNGKNRANVSD